MLIKIYHVVSLLPLLVGLVLSFGSVEAAAQEVKGDSAVQLLPMQSGEGQKQARPSGELQGTMTSTATPSELPLPDPASPGRDSLITLDVQRLLYPHLLVLPFSLNPTLLYKGDFHTSGSLFSYRTGQIWLEGEQRSLPGIGRINEVSALWSQQLTDRFSLQAAVVTTQLNMEFFHRHVLQLQAQMSYRLTEQLTLHLFGSYDTGNPYNPYGRQWGGSIDWRISPRFGLEGGVRRSYNAVTGRWETLPIVAPYYKINGKFRLQIDTGPLIQQLIRGAVYGNEGRGNPTIAPPKNHIDIR